MKNRVAAVAVTLFLACATLGAQDPGVALDDAKAHLAAKRFPQAVAAATAGIDAAEQLQDEKVRQQALAALHFYAAAAYHGAGDQDSARSHLEEFFRLAPASRRLDPARYDAQFIALFDAVASTRPSDSFEKLYPGYDPNSLATPNEQQQNMSNTAAVEILGTAPEKKEWRSLETSAARQRFLDAFWSRRDETPATPRNEYREQFERRAAFADVSFGSDFDHGSFTDRGRVFILLGPPAYVRRRPINNSDRVRVVGTEAFKTVNGTIEHWVYTREQLPVAFAKPTVMYRFVTQYGIGDNVLQKDNVFGLNALGEAAKPPRER